MKNLQDSYTLYNGCKIPCIGYGTWKTPEGDATFSSTLTALVAGYRHIDTAAAYGNEVDVGKAIEASEVSHRDLFVTTKLWNQDRGYDKALAAFELSLKNLGLDYLDLYLIHWPAAQGAPSEWAGTNADTWRAFERLYREGLVKAIGVSNFKIHHLEALLATANIKPMVNQIEFHPGFMQEEVLNYCREKKILVEAWSPLGSGAVLSDERLLQLAKSYNRSVAQLCIRWALQQGVLPLPKSTNKERMRKNAEVFDFEISAKDMAYLNSLPEIGFSGLDPDKVTF